MADRWTQNAHGTRRFVFRGDSSCTADVFWVGHNAGRGEWRGAGVTTGRGLQPPTSSGAYYDTEREAKRGALRACGRLLRKSGAWYNGRGALERSQDREF